MLNTQGSQLAKDIASLSASSKANYDGTQLFNKNYGDLFEIRGQYRTGKIEDQRIAWQDSTKALQGMKAQLRLGTPAQQAAMGAAYKQEVINNLKDFAAAQQPGFWQKLFTLGFAQGGQFKFFGNEVDATAERNDAGKVIGLKIGDIVVEINDMKGEFSPEFVNAFVAAADINTESQRQSSR